MVFGSVGKMIIFIKGGRDVRIVVVDGGRMEGRFRGVGVLRWM